MEHILILGGVAGGMSAASKARRVAPDARVTVYTDENDISYAGCGLPYYAEGLMEREDLFARSPGQFESEGIGVHRGHRALAIHPAEKRVTIRDPQGKEFLESYDKLIIATGARPIVPDIPGVDLPCVHRVKNVDDATSIRRVLQGGAVKSAVVIGGGFIGAEMTEALHGYGVRVTLVEMAPQILTILDEEMAKLVEDYLRDKGVDICLGEGATAIEEDGEGCVVVTQKQRIAADLIILAIGIRPNSEIAAEAGIELSVKGAIQVNERMETSLPDIYAAGDCAAAHHLVTGRDAWVPLGSTANKQGRVAGENAAGGHATFKGILGTSIFRTLDMEVARTGLSSREAAALGLDYWDSTVRANTLVGAFPGTGKMHVKLVIERGTNKLLGGQIVGSARSAKRIDTLAALLYMGGTLDDLARLDLAYAPPFAEVWDAFLIAANVARSKAEKEE